MADGAIRVETKLDTKGMEKGINEVDKMCNGTKEHIKEMVGAMNVKTAPLVIVNNSELKKAKEELEKINSKIERIREETDILLPRASNDKQVVNLLEVEEYETENLLEKQKQLNDAIEKYNAEKSFKNNFKQNATDVKSVNADVSNDVSADGFLEKISSVKEYEAALEETKAKMRSIEEATQRLASQKGIDPADALSVNKEYQKLKSRIDALNNSNKKFKNSSKTSFAAAQKGAKSVGDSIKQCLKKMAKFTLAIFGARSAFFAVKNAIKQVLTDNEDLNNTVTAMKGVFANALTPVIEKIVYWLKYAFAYLNLFVKVLTGVDMVANYNAKAINKQTEATKKNAKATKEASLQLASFDEKNVLSKNKTDDSKNEKAATLDLPDVSGGKFEEICENIKAHINELEMLLGVALLATGFILLAAGQIPVGIACIIAGISVMAVALGSWNELSEKTRAMITEIMAIAGGAFLAIGLILIGTGVKMPLGVAMVAIGAALLVAAVVLNWSKMSNKVKNVITIIMAIVSAATLVIGAILCLSGVKLPLGVALIAVGAAALITDVALNWERMPEKIKIAVLTITAVLSVALLVIGAILVFTYSNLPLGIALMAAGAVGLVASIVVLWNAMPDKIKNIISIITAIVSVALLVLGIILCATGANLPLGVALIAAGAIGLVTVISLNKDVIVGWIKEAWAKVKNFWNSTIRPIFTKQFWLDKFNTIKQGMKGALNGVISAVETAINWIVEKLNTLHFSLPDKVAKVVGFSGIGFNFSMVSLPRLAKGGIVNNPGKGRAVIAGEAGAEAILPLQNNTEWMDVLSEKVAEKISMNIVNKIILDGKDIHTSNQKYDARFNFATNGGVL